MKRILAVDDEQDLLDVVSEFFAGRYHVVTATSGDAALEMIRRQRPDVVFLDVNMPGLSGLESSSACASPIPRCRSSW
jgi:CheY-like chemotaxis protein